MPGMWNEIEKIYLGEGVQIGDSEVSHDIELCSWIQPRQSRIILRRRCCWPPVYKIKSRFCKHRPQVGSKRWSHLLDTRGTYSVYRYQTFFLSIFVERSFFLNFLGTKITRCLASMSHHCQTVRTLRNLSKNKNILLESEQCHL
jgi:hypothetical protein